MLIAIRIPLISMNILLEIVPNESLPREVMDRLGEKAERLGISTEELLARILKRAAETQEEEADREAA